MKVRFSNTREETSTASENWNVMRPWSRLNSTKLTSSGGVTSAVTVLAFIPAISTATSTIALTIPVPASK
jgi:hypothetical protein